MRPETLADYAAFLRRQTFAVVSIFVLIAGVVLAVGLRMPRVYVASVVLEVEDASANPISILPNVVQTALGGGADPVMLQTMMGRLSSRTLLERVLLDFDDTHPIGADLLPPTPHLTRKIRASVETGSRLVRINVELRESEGGARNASLLANQIAETFRRQLRAEETAERYHEAKIQLVLVQGQSEKLVGALGRFESDLFEFVSAEGNPTLWTAELQQLIARQQQLLQERRAADFAVREIEAVAGESAEAVEREPVLVPSGTSEGTHPLLTSIAGQLLAYEAQEAKRIGAGANPDSPELRGIRAAQDLLDDRLERLPDSALTNTHSLNVRREWFLERDAEDTLSRIRMQERIRRVDELLKTVDEELGRHVSDIPQLEVRLEILRGQAQSVRAVYEDLLMTQAQMEIALGAATAEDPVGVRSIAGVSIVDVARPQLRPVRPRASRLLVTGAVLGLLAGLAVAFTLEWRAVGSATGGGIRG